MTFKSFFSELLGYSPFPWQLQLTKGAWQDITAPTGAGKTAVIAAWFWRLANGKNAPTRLIYLVDRRMIVDDVYRYAARIAQTIADATEGPVREIADRIRKSHGVETPVLVTRLRGGTWRDESWAQSPHQPLVIASTVDQAGSRLLGRGYGCSRSMQVVSCGLLGNDSLFVVDESHLSQPFVANLRRCIEMHGSTIQKPPILVEMTATPENIDNSIGLTESDLKNKVLKKRLDAKKPTELVQVAVPDKAKEETKRGLVANKILNLCQATESNVVGVVCNSVALARQVHQKLEAKGHEAILLTGRSRPHERDLVFFQYRERIAAGRDRSGDTKLFVVATQCIEAGVDLDVDEMVSELAPLDSLRQRAGRLNRLGELENTQLKIVARSDKTKRRDFIYGDSLKETWRWLKGKKKELDLGLSLDVPTGDDILPLIAPKPEYSLLEQQDIKHLGAIQLPLAFPLDSFLHGKRKPSSMIGVCWRGGLSDLTDNSLESINNSLEMLRPKSAEICQVPAWDIRNWLGEKKVAIRWNEDGAELVHASDLQSHDTIVVPVSYGGCDKWGWNPDSVVPVEDIADDVASRISGRRISRIYSAEKPSVNAKRFAGGWLIVGDFEQHVLEEFARVSPGQNKTNKVAVRLENHSEGVAAIAKQFAPEGFGELLRKAGELHDIGKSDPRWQYAITGGEFDSVLWAKSSDLPIHQYFAALKQSGLPKGWRHETLSTQLAEQITQNELVLHLVASHHGWSHPWPRNITDPNPPAILPFKLLKHDVVGMSATERDDLTQTSLANRCAERFRIVEATYGMWQRCYLESILILADWNRSKSECEPQAVAH